MLMLDFAAFFPSPLLAEFPPVIIWGSVAFFPLLASAGRMALSRLYTMSLFTYQFSEGAEDDKHIRRYEY
jgi:hypothetical protein